MEEKEQITVLLAEDDDGHARLIERGFEDAGLNNPLIRFKDGQETWDFISGKSKACSGPVPPYLLLLDIRMPNMDGLEVLRRVRSDRNFKDMPIAMLTTSDEPREIQRCYALGCNSFFIKPLDVGELAAIFKLRLAPHKRACSPAGAAANAPPAGQRG